MVCLHSSRLLLATLCLLGVAQSSSGPWPGTSRTVHFEITLTWENIHVAGASRKMILTNGQFPGPTLQLKQGEDVEFLVRNHLPFATTIHFHGYIPTQYLLLSRESVLLTIRRSRD
jgi:FtsP/CotA-like multicopper oxidase with cupredoxin domain